MMRQVYLEPFPVVELRWKRKGGRSVAEGAGTTWRVEDDGAYSYRLPSGAWEHLQAGSAEAAREACAWRAAVLQERGRQEAEDLAARREMAAQLAALDPRDRRWVASAAKLLVMVSHDGVPAGYILDKIQSRDLREFLATMTGDAEFMAAVAQQPRAVAMRALEDSMLCTLGGVRGGEG